MPSRATFTMTLWTMNAAKSASSSSKADCITKAPDAAPRDLTLAIPTVRQPLPERRREHQPAILPQRIRAALQAEGRFRPDIAGEDLAIIADLLDDVIGPVLREPHLLAEIVADTEEPLHFRVWRILAHI